MTPTPVDGESARRADSRKPQFSCLFSRSERSNSATFGRTEAKPEQRDVGKSVEFVLRAFAAALILFSLSDRGLASVLADTPVVQTQSVPTMENETLPTAIPAAERTIARLIHEYKTDPYSAYHKGRFATRQNTDSILRRIAQDCGHELVSSLNGRKVIGRHQDWLGPDGKKIPMAHALIGGLRTVTGYGVTMLEWEECRTLKMVLSGLRFPMSKPRKVVLTTPQVIAIINKAHEMGLHSIALEQAIQHGCTFRQKDCIGEWVPVTDPGVAIVMDGEWKWLRGVHWGEVSADLILTHVTSKRSKEVTVDFKLAPLIMTELKRIAEIGDLRGGPMIVSEATGLPYRSYDFRRVWRSVADACGIPKEVRNMDTRAGAITEALGLGANLQDVRKGATHSQESQTQAYSRGDEEAIRRVMAKRGEQHQKLLGEAA